jgi:hypothetical protein
LPFSATAITLLERGSLTARLWLWPLSYPTG